MSKKPEAPPRAYTAHLVDEKGKARINVSGEPVGWCILCGYDETEFMTLLDHKYPFTSTEQALRILDNIIDTGACRYTNHRVVPVYAVYMGKPKKAPVTQDA